MKIQLIIYIDINEDNSIALYDCDDNMVYYICKDSDDTTHLSLSEFKETKHIISIYELKYELSSGWVGCLIFEALSPLDFYEIICYSIYDEEDKHVTKDNIISILDNDNKFIKIS